MKLIKRGNKRGIRINCDQGRGGDKGPKGNYTWVTIIICELALPIHLGRPTSFYSSGARVNNSNTRF